jgi:hypothetical protein
MKIKMVQDIVKNTVRSLLSYTEIRTSHDVPFKDKDDKTFLVRSK